MGWTFSVSLMRRVGTLSETKKALLRALKRELGYVPAKDGEEPEVAMTLYYEKGGWLSMASEEIDFVDDIEKENPLLQRLSSAIGTSMLYFNNYDSDILLAALTDGARTQFACCGHPEVLEEFGLPTETGDLSLFDALLPDADARSRLRKILKSRPVFSEEIVADLAELLGFSQVLALLSPEAEPYAQIPLVKAKPRKSISFLLPETLPPAFSIPDGYGIPGDFTVLQAACGGGEGRGLRLTVEPENYDADGWEIPIVTFMPPAEQVPDRFEYASFAVPERQLVGPDNRPGWVAECPDIPLHRGVNTEYKNLHCLKAQRYHTAHDALVYLAFFKKDAAAPDPLTRFTRFTLTPLENPAGAVTYTFPLHAFEPQTHEGKVVNDWWMGPYSPYNHK